MDYLNLLVEKRREFSIYLINDLYTEINKGINSLYVNCKNKNTDINEALILFQQILGDVPKWNDTIIALETNRIKKSIHYIEDLLTAVFISNMRMLCSIKNKDKQINVKVPKLENFIHKCYIEVAKQFWSYTYFFNENINKLEIQKNKRHIENIIKASIEEVIRRSLPIKSILKDYLETNLETETNTEISDNLLDIIESNKKSNKKNETESLQKDESEKENLSEKEKIKDTDNKINEGETQNISNNNNLSDTNLVENKYNIEKKNECDFEFDEKLFLNNIDHMSLEDNIVDAPDQLYAQNIKIVALENEDTK